MNLSDIRYENVGEKTSGELLLGEISGASCSVINLSENALYTESVSPDEAVVIVSLCGRCNALGKEYEGITVFAFAPGDAVEISSDGASFLRISWKLNDGETVDVSKLPYALEYAAAVKYREDCKSEKTVSRMLLPEGIIPRLAMGSVQTTGPDRVEKHEHPFCDQLFFSLPENDMLVDIDDVAFPMQGNTLLHIPLASSHGVTVPPRGTAHYLWIDFIIDPRGIEYMHSAHEEIK